MFAFKPRQDEDSEAMAKKRAWVRLVAGIILDTKPEARAAIQAACTALSVAEEGAIMGIVEDQLNHHADDLARHPNLALRIRDLMIVMGLEAPQLNVPVFRDLLAEVCNL